MSAHPRKGAKPKPKEKKDMNTTELTAAVADLIRRSTEGDRIFDCNFAVTVNTEDGSFDCCNACEICGPVRRLLTADAIIAFCGGTDDAEAWAAANPEDAAAQYVHTFLFDLSDAVDRLMTEA